MEAIPRLEVVSMRFSDKVNSDSNKYINGEDTGNNCKPIDFNGPFRVFINDGLRVHEIYNSAKENNFFTPLPKQMQHSVGIQKNSKCSDSISGHTDLSRLMGQSEEEEEEEELQESRDFIDLPLTGPEGDMVAWDYFNAIFHQDSGNPIIDDLHLAKATPFYLKRRGADPSDVLSHWMFRRVRDYHRRIPIQVLGSFGSLILECIAFKSSRSVTVEVSWIFGRETEGYERTVDCHAYRTLICGKLSLCNSTCYNTSVLLKTPKGKGMVVTNGKPILLLRSKVAIPDCEFFTVEASLHDPFNNSVVKGPVSFLFDDFSEKNRFHLCKDIVGTGANLMVHVSMEPNDLGYLKCRPTSK